MGTFTIEAPNGKSYTIEGDNAQGALDALQKHLGERLRLTNISKLRLTKPRQIR
jgi:hypothetical protein